MAVALYHDRCIHAADIDPKRVATAKSRLPDATVIEADCNMWPFDGLDVEFAIADFDAYMNPYPSLEAFWRNARKKPRVVLIMTDGLRQSIARNRSTVELPEGRLIPATTVQFKAQYHMWLKRFVEPYVAGLIAPYRITRTLAYTRHHMLYWGVVAEQ